MNCQQGLSKHYFWGAVSRIHALPGVHLTRNTCLWFVEIANVGRTDDFSSRAKRCQSLFCIVFTKTKSYPRGENWGFLEHLTVTVVNGPVPLGNQQRVVLVTALSCHVLSRHKLEIILCKTNESLFSYRMFFNAFQLPHRALCHSSDYCSLHPGVCGVGHSGICLVLDHNAFQQY